MNHSESIKELAAALVAAQAEMPVVPKEADNPYFKSKYADLASIVKMIQPVLHKNNLAVIQTMEDVETGVGVRTTLLHSSGQYISGVVRMTPSKNDPQGIGSAITYARIYSLSAILGLATEEDDDGAAASGTVVTKAPAKTPDMAKKKAGASTVDKARGLYMKFSELGWKQDAILKEFNRVTGKSDVKKLTEEDLSKLDEALLLHSKTKEAKAETKAEVLLVKEAEAVAPEDLLA